MKTCTKCGIEKDLTEFNKRKSSKDGYRTQCRKCEHTPVPTININGKRICNTCNVEKDLIDFKKKKLFAYKCNECFVKCETSKTCNICNLEKDINEFNLRKDNGRYRNECKECRYKTTNEWINNNIDYVIAYQKEYAKSDKAKLADKNRYQNKKSKQTPKIKPPKQTTEERKEKRKNYYINNKDIIQKRNYEWHKNKIKTDPTYRLKKRARAMINLAFKRNGFTKSSKTHTILGISFKEFKLYIESKFEFWMNWENYGKYNGELNYGWDIDHVIPLETAKTEEDIIRLNHYTNLQPLCSKVNRDIKRDLVF